MMRSLLVILSALLVVGFGFWAYNVNYETQGAMRRVAALQDSIAGEREAMTMLRAEWAWLNRPERIKALVATAGATLELAPLDGAQFGEVSLVAWPEPPETALEEGWDGLTREDITVTEVTARWHGVRPQPRPEAIAATLRVTR